ncbi:RAB6-interacting golgin isoform X3 [Stigmatopora argus]
MSGWAGFSEDELRSVQKKESAIASVRKLRPPNLSRQQLQREMSLRTAQTFAGFVSHDLQPEKPLNKLSPRGVHDSTAKMDMQHCLGEEKKQENCKAAIVKQNPAIKEPEKQKIELHDKTRLEHLKSEQKIIEESNKRKKALLAKTIAAKSQQTQAEAVKLKRIQIELQALDDQVSNDIGILRGKIEQASWDYTTARCQTLRSAAHRFRVLLTSGPKSAGIASSTPRDPNEDKAVQKEEMRLFRAQKNYKWLSSTNAHRQIIPLYYQKGGTKTEQEWDFPLPCKSGTTKQRLSMSRQS